MKTPPHEKLLAALARLAALPRRSLEFDLLERFFVYAGDCELSEHGTLEGAEHAVWMNGKHGWHVRVRRYALLEEVRHQ
jgi:hypothetical protein